MTSRQQPRERADLASAAWELMRAFVDEHSRSGKLREQLQLGVGSGRIRVLFLLRERPMTLAEIADAHGVDRPYATIIVDKLEALGFVDRSPHPTDRRSKVVSLTPAGREAAVTAERILQEPPAPLTALSEGQLTELVGLLTQLRAVLDRGGDPPEPPAALRTRAVVLRRHTGRSPGLKARFAGPVASGSP